MGYSEGEEKYPDKFAVGICRPLVDAGEYDSMEDCKSAAKDNASTQASNWADQAPSAMKDFLEA